MYLTLLILTVIIFVAVCAYFVQSPAFSFFHPVTIYLAFHGLVFVVRPLFAWFYGYTAIYDLYLFKPDAYAKNMALIVANLGLLCFTTACLHWGNAPFKFKSDPFIAREAVSLTRPLMIVFALLLPLVVYSTYLTWQVQSGDLAVMRLDKSTGTTINTGGVGYVIGAQLFCSTLVAIIAWVGRFRFWAVLPAALFLIVRAGMGGRGAIIAMVLCFSAFYLYDKRRRFPDWRIVVAIVTAVMLFNFIGADRGYRVRTLFVDEPAPYQWSHREMAPMEGMDAGNLEFLEYLTDKVPRATGSFEYFADNLQLLTEPVPRVWWKDKPIGSPVQFFSLFDYGFPIGMTRSLPGEGWVQLGLLGVAVWCSLWGALLGWTYNLYVNSRQTVIQTAFYFSLLACLTVFYRDGMLITMVKQVFFFLLPACLWYLLAMASGVPREWDFRHMVAARLRQRSGNGGSAPGEALETARPLPPRSQRWRVPLSAPPA